MNKPGSVFSMESGGFTYGHPVQAVYLLAMTLQVEALPVTEKLHFRPPAEEMPRKN